MSVHLLDFPDVSMLPDDSALVRDMDRVRDVCNTALSIRNTENIRIRQPLQSLTIIAKDAKNLEPYKALIQDEVNVKEIELNEHIDEHADFQLKINFPVLGKRLPKKMKQLIPASKKGEWTQTENGLIEILGETLTTEECTLELKPKESNGTQALSSNDALVKLNLEIPQILYLEGLARDLVRLIQQSRKEANLNVSDRITINIKTDNSNLQQAIDTYTESNIYSMAEQTLAVNIATNQNDNYHFSYTHNLDDSETVISFTVAA